MGNTKKSSYAEYTEEELLVVKEKCKKNYLNYPNVIGVGIGLKFVNNQMLEEKLCIQFYVRRKISDSQITKKKLPKFVYRRFKNGSIDYSNKIITDVILLNNLCFTCKAGTVVDVIGESGALTLVFKNKIGNQSTYYALTCAHVAGNVLHTPPINPSMESSCCQSSTIFATTVVNSTDENRRLAYDIALAKISDECSPQPELEINGSTTKIESFLPSEEIRVSMTLECNFPVSNIISAMVSGRRTSLPIALDGVLFTVENLFKIDQEPLKGDSGSLLFDGSSAVGILVARADGFGFFQPLGEAFDHLREISPEPIKCF